MVSIESKQHTLLAIKSFFLYAKQTKNLLNSSRSFTAGLFGRLNGGKVKKKYFVFITFKK